VCNCATDQLCNSEGATDLVCSTLDKVCTPKCTTDTDCGAGRTCDTATGQCKAGGGGTTCTGTSQSTCSYGQFCSNSTCTPAPVAPTTCQNFSSNRPTWSATSSNGPVIYSATVLRYEVNSSLCQSGDAFVFSIRAYRTDADWPATRSGLPGFFYVTTGGQQTDVVANLLLPNTGYNRSTTNLKDAEFQTYLCFTGTSIQAAYYFTGGNPICQTFTKP
jgi:Cys-rich repeat protein